MIEKGSSRVLAISGGVLMLISAGLPWFRSVTGSKRYFVVPLSEGLIQSSVWILVLGISAGLVLLVTTDSPGLLGSCGIIWLNTSIVVWIFGSKSAWLFSFGSLPDGALITLGVGTSIGLLGGLLTVVGAAVVLAEQTWKLPDIKLPSWVHISALMLLVGVVAIREVPWAKVGWGYGLWNVDFGIVPILGDVLAILLFVGAVLLLVGILRPRSWVSVSLITVGVGMAVIGIIALGSGALISKLSKVIVDQVDLGDSEVNVLMTKGPVAVVILGLAVLSFGILTLRGFDKGERLPRGPKLTTNTEVVDDPFLSF